MVYAVCMIHPSRIGVVRCVCFFEMIVFFYFERPYNIDMWYYGRSEIYVFITFFINSFFLIFFVQKKHRILPVVVRLHFVHPVELHPTMVLPLFLIYLVGQNQKMRYGSCGVQHDGRIGCLKPGVSTARVQILLLARVVIKEHVVQIQGVIFLLKIFWKN